MYLVQNPAGAEFLLLQLPPTPLPSHRHKTELTLPSPIPIHKNRKPKFQSYTSSATEEAPLNNLNIILFFGPCIFIIEGRTDQRNAQINFSLINLLLFKLLRHVSATQLEPSSGSLKSLQVTSHCNLLGY